MQLKYACFEGSWCIFITKPPIPPSAPFIPPSSLYSLCPSLIPPLLMPPSCLCSLLHPPTSLCSLCTPESFYSLFSPTHPSSPFNPPPPHCSVSYVPTSSLCPPCPPPTPLLFLSPLIPLLFMSPTHPSAPFPNLSSLPLHLPPLPDQMLRNSLTKFDFIY